MSGFPVRRRAFALLFACLIRALPSAAGVDEGPPTRAAPTGLTNARLLHDDRDGGCTGFLWSPDGRWLAIGATGRGVVLLRPGEEDTTYTFPAGWVGPYRMCWSIDGRSLYYSEDLPREASRWRRLYRIMKIVPGSLSQSCFVDSLPWPARPHAVPGGIGFSDTHGEHPLFLDESGTPLEETESLFFVQTCWRDEWGSTLDVYLVRSSGRTPLLQEEGGRHRLLQAVSPACDRAIVMGTPGLLVADLDDGEARVYAEGYTCDFAQWHPEGDWVFFCHTTDDGHRILTSDIYAVSTATGSVRRLTDTPAIEERVAVSPDGRNMVFRATPGAWIAEIVYDSTGTGEGTNVRPGREPRAETHEENDE